MIVEMAHSMSPGLTALLSIFFSGCLWTMYCVPGTVPGMGDMNSKTPALVDRKNKIVTEYVR